MEENRINYTTLTEVIIFFLSLQLVNCKVTHLIRLSSLIWRSADGTSHSFSCRDARHSSSCSTQPAPTSDISCRSLFSLISLLPGCDNIDYTFTLMSTVTFTTYFHKYGHYGNNLLNVTWVLQFFDWNSRNKTEVARNHHFHFNVVTILSSWASKVKRDPKRIHWTQTHHSANLWSYSVRGQPYFF